MRQEGDNSGRDTPTEAADLLEPDEVEAGPMGVPGLHWPVRIDEERAVRDTLLEVAAPAIREALETGSPTAASVAVVSSFFVLDAIAAYRRFAGTVRLGARNATSRQSTPPVEASAGRAITARLRRGHPAPAVWRLAGRMGRGYATRDEFRHLPITSRTCREGIVSTTASNFARFHARAINEPVTLARYDTWFAPLKPADHVTQQSAPDLVDSLVESVATAFEAGSEVLADHIRSELRDSLETTAGLALAHLERARGRPTLVPQRLWTGTGGDLWGRLLRALVSEADGEVVGHDHATGFGHYRTDLRAWYEFPFCTDYVVFNPAQVRATTAHLRHEILVTPEPRIRTVAGRARSARPEVPATTRAAAAGPGAERVMYVGPFYTTGAHLYPQLPYPVQVDLESRLLTWFRERGFAVILKPHPESARPPHPFLRGLGEVVEQRFEDVLDRADTFLFISSTSTAFTNALWTDRSIVLVDTKAHLWDPEAMQLLRRRCAVVLPEFDDHGRVVFDEGALADAVTMAPELRDDAFARTYLTFETG